MRPSSGLQKLLLAAVLIVGACSGKDDGGQGLVANEDSGVGRTMARLDAAHDVIPDVPDPEPGPAEMVLAVRDCGICGSDLHFGYGKRDFAFTIDMLARGRIDASPVLSETVSWDSFPTAFEALRTDKSRVKVMLEPR